MDEADIRIITGDQGQGKSTTGVAYPVDDYYAQASAIHPITGKIYPIANFYPHLTLLNKGKEFYVPDNYLVKSPVKIFANFHFFGVKAMYTDLATIIEYLNSGLITDGWIVIDESFMADSRQSMSLTGQVIAWFGATIRKRSLHFLLLSQYESFLEKRYRAFATKRVMCQYNKKTKKVTLSIRQKGQKQSKILSYDSMRYRRFYNTNELIQIPEGKLARALMSAR